MSNANNGTSTQTDYRGTINYISMGRTIEGAKVGGTINEISIGETIEGVEARS
jgi:hypothetical protein